MALTVCRGRCLRCSDVNLQLHSNDSVDEQVTLTDLIWIVIRTQRIM